MNTNSPAQERAHDELDNLSENAKALLSATADVADEKVAEARNRLSAALSSAKEVCATVKQKAVEGAKATDSVIRTHPYESIAVAFGVGALLGFLISRRN